MAFLRPIDAAAALGMHAETLRDLANRGKLPQGAVKLTPGGHARYDIEVIADWMEQAFADHISEEIR